MRGQFILYPGEDREMILRNSVLNDGQEAFLGMIFNASATYASFYCGLMGSAYEDTTTLADLVGVSEPTIGTNAYARMELARDATDWPEIAKVNGEWRVRSKLMTFQPVGGDFDKPVLRMFLASVGVGAAGKLFTVSGVAAAPITVTVAEPLPVIYELWMPN